VRSAMTHGSNRSAGGLPLAVRLAP
jgi:hypothetical protein